MRFSLEFEFDESFDGREMPMPTRLLVEDEIRRRNEDTPEELARDCPWQRLAAELASKLEKSVI